MPASYTREPYAQHLDKMLRRWDQGDHILVSGPTKSGKTTLVKGLLDLRYRRGGSVVGLFTKWQDDTIDTMFGGYERFDRWPRRIPEGLRTMAIWPHPLKTLGETRRMHQEVMKEALDRAAIMGKWCVYIDETLYMTDRQFGNLSAEIGQLHYFARSSKLSVVSTAQRPFYIPRIIMSSVSHAYIARTRDADDVKRLADLSNVNPKELAAQLAALPTRHDFIYVNTQGDADPVIVNTHR